MAVIVLARLRTSLRTMAVAARLGWSIESNWTDPFTFLVYALLRPVASVLIIVAMVKLAPAGIGGEDDALFEQVYLGNALFVFVQGVLIGIGWTITEDRDRYQMLKYVYVAPLRFYDFLFGRCVTKLAGATLSFAVLAAFGVLALGVRAPLPNLPLAAAAFALGLVGILWFSVLFAGVALVITSREGYLIEGTAGVVFILSGAIFPIDMLPAFVRPVALALPLAHWIELVRRGVYGRGFSPAFAGLSDGAMLGVLALSTAAAWALARAGFAACERHARRKGLIDLVRSY